MGTIFIYEILYFQAECIKNMHSKIFIEIWAPNKRFKVRFCLRKIPCDLFLVPSHVAEKGPRRVPAFPQTSSLMGSLSMMVFRVLAEGRASELI